MFNRALDWHTYDGPNPVEKIKFYRESSEVRGYSEESVRRLLCAARAISEAPDPDSPVQKYWHDMVILVLNTGLRRTELLNLKWRDVQDRELRITGKGNRRRTIPLNDAAQEVLARQVRHDSYLWELPNRSQTGILRRTFEHMRRLTGEDFKLHRLHHTFATSLLAAGIDIVTIADILGHGRVLTSLLYSHSSPERLRQAVNSIKND